MVGDDQRLSEIEFGMMDRVEDDKNSQRGLEMIRDDRRLSEIEFGLMDGRK